MLLSTSSKEPVTTATTELTTTTQSKETKFKHTNNVWFYFTNNQPGLLYQSNQNFPSKLTEIDEIQNLIPTFPFPWFYPNSPTAGSIQNYESQQSNPR